MANDPGKQKKRAKGNVPGRSDPEHIWTYHGVETSPNMIWLSNVEQSSDLKSFEDIGYDPSTYCPF